MDSEPIILADGLSRHFGEVIAVDRLNLKVHPGEVFGFLGHNGAGKTTTVRLLNGILDPTEGSARVLGLDPQEHGPTLRRRTGILTETPSLDERLTGRDNLEIYGELYDVPQGEIPGRIHTLMDTFELTDRADDKVGDYSKGMKQRLALARALLHEPELLFLDEPTTGLDPVASRRVHQMIHYLSEQQKRTIFLCTHNLAEAQALCDRVAVLEHGKLVAMGSPTDLIHQLGYRLVLEIEVAPNSISKARQALSSIPGIRHSTLKHEILSITGAVRESIPDLVESLVRAGVPIYRVASQEPSLEDVYFSLHGERENRA